MEEFDYETAIKELDVVSALAREREAADRELIKIGEYFEGSGEGKVIDTSPLFGLSSTIKGVCLSMSGEADTHELFTYNQDSDGNLWEIELSYVPPEQLTDTHKEFGINWGCASWEKVSKKKADKILDVFSKYNHFEKITNSFTQDQPCFNYIKKRIIANKFYEVVEVVAIDLGTFEEKTMWASLGYMYLDESDPKGVLEYFDSVEDFLREEIWEQQQLIYTIEEVLTHKEDIEEHEANLKIAKGAMFFLQSTACLSAFE